LLVLLFGPLAFYILWLQLKAEVRYKKSFLGFAGRLRVKLGTTYGHCKLHQNIKIQTSICSIDQTFRNGCRIYALLVETVRRAHKLKAATHKWKEQKYSEISGFCRRPVIAK
jgi:hypothetical protein